MSPLIIGFIGIGILLLLFVLRMPIAFAMGVVGLVGYSYLSGLKGGLDILGMSAFSTSASFTLSVIPLFVLMGEFVSNAGLGKDLYYSVYRWLGHMSGGLASATIAACAGFAAICGSSVATAATVGTIAIPEMQRYKYDTKLAVGAVAAGGTLGMLIPPSTTFVIYGIITEVSIGKLFIAGIFPGLLLTAMFIVMIYVRTKFNPALGPPGPKTTIREKLTAIKSTWGIFALFILVIGGIYLGMFTPTEAAGVGAFGALILALSRRQLTWRRFWDSLVETGHITAMCLVIIVFAYIFGYFMAMSRIPTSLAKYIVELELDKYVVIAGIMAFYLVLGCFMEGFAMLILTVPIILPLVEALGFNPIWFGVLMVLECNMGLITPPVGINVFVISGVVKDVPMNTIFAGIVPFLVVMILCVIIVVAFPQIALFLPSIMR